jgi:hypothetical protein
MKKLLDSHSGVTTNFHYDEMTDTSTISREQDVEAILENNKALQTHNDGYSPSREMKRVASIPMVIAEQWMKEDGLNWMNLPKHEKGMYLRKKLNSSDYRFLKTSEGTF